METNTLLIIIGLVTVVFVINAYLPKGKRDLQNSNRPGKKAKPREKIDNDKIVVVRNVKSGEIKQAIQQFCTLYNQDSYRAIPTLTIISDVAYAITFPYDIDFETFCYFVNYIYYPNDIIYKPNIRAWTTTRIGDSWMKDDIVNKRVMLYIPTNDQDYDNVYLTTLDNLGYKMGFALGETSQRLDDPRQNYIEPKIDLNNYSGRETLEFK